MLRVYMADSLEMLGKEQKQRAGISFFPLTSDLNLDGMKIAEYLSQVPTSKQELYTEHKN